MADIEEGSGKATNSERLAEARMQLHSVVQWLARVARSYGRDSDEQNLILQWRDDGTITTQTLEADLGVELKLPDLIMQFTENGSPSRHEIDMEDRSPAHVEAWILIELLHRNMDRAKFSKDLPYDVSGLMAGDGVEFSPDAYEPELGELTARFRTAARIISRAGRSDGGSTPPIRFLPEDMSIEVSTGPASGSATSGRTFGFASGADADTPEPFFYIGRTVQGARSVREATLRLSALPPGAFDRTVTQFFMEAEERA
jgi:hypothetical protein